MGLDSLFGAGAQDDFKGRLPQGVELDAWTNPDGEEFMSATWPDGTRLEATWNATEVTITHLSSPEPGVYAGLASNQQMFNFLANHGIQRLRAYARDAEAEALIKSHGGWVGTAPGWLVWELS